MDAEFEARIRDLARRRASSAIIDAIKHEYEFQCPAFIYAGPGHQSRHTCTYRRPHGVDGEHHDSMYEWVGTAVEATEMVPCPRLPWHVSAETCPLCNDTGERSVRKLVRNAVET